jgi:hypothetical protein
MGSLLHCSPSTRFVLLKKCWHFCFAAAIVCFSTIGEPALLLAEPPPIPEDELTELCDLVVTADLLSVRRLPPQQGSLLAKAKVVETHKGKATVGRTLDVYFGLPSGAPGDSGIAMYAGQRWKLFLLKNESDTESYHPFAHNEGELVTDVAPALQVLPKLPGNVIYAPGQQPKKTTVYTPTPRRFRFFRRR